MKWWIKIFHFCSWIIRSWENWSSFGSHILFCRHCYNRINYFISDLRSSSHSSLLSLSFDERFFKSIQRIKDAFSLWIFSINFMALELIFRILENTFLVILRLLWFKLGWDTFTLHLIVSEARFNHRGLTFFFHNVLPRWSLSKMLFDKFFIMFTSLSFNHKQIYCFLHCGIQKFCYIMLLRARKIF